MKYLQAQDSLNTQMVTDELLPLLHPDLDMEKNGENDTAKLMENTKRLIALENDACPRGFNRGTSF